MRLETGMTFATSDVVILVFPMSISQIIGIAFEEGSQTLITRDSIYDFNTYFDETALGACATQVYYSGSIEKEAGLIEAAHVSNFHISKLITEDNPPKW